jgi:hypothetical protein
MVNKLIGKMWKRAAVAYCRILSQHSPGKTEENVETDRILAPI